MKRKDWNFGLWCRAATAKIHYRPDRKHVYAELQGHLEDAYDAFIAQGMTEEEAEQNALKSMGNAEDLAAQLAKIHSPFWAYVLQASQILLAVILILCVIPLWDYATDLNLYDKPNRREFEIYEESCYGGDTGRFLHHLSHPDISFSSDGNTFTVTDSALFTEYYGESHEKATRLYLLIRQTNLLPWQEHKEYLNQLLLPITAHFFIRDHLGNEYPIYDGSGWTCHGVQSGIFTYTHECWINDFPSDAPWAELCYERDGRKFALRIDLTGGDPA